MSRRIYKVTAGEEVVAMVAASSQSAAIRAVIGDQYKATPATGIEVARYMKAGGDVTVAPGRKSGGES